MVDDTSGFMGTCHDATDELAEVEFSARVKQEIKDAGLRALADFIRAPYGRAAIPFSAFCQAFANKQPNALNGPADPEERPEFERKIKRHFNLQSALHRGMALNALKERIGNEPDRSLQAEMYLLLELLK